MGELESIQVHRDEKQEIRSKSLRPNAAGAYQVYIRESILDGQEVYSMNDSTENKRASRRLS
jgi:hypothetical protein